MITLRRLDLAHPFGGASIFATRRRALEHVCDHVLTRPEAHYWGLLIPGYSDCVDADDGDALYRLARSLWSDRPPTQFAQTLYDGYADAIEQELAVTARLGWYWQEDETAGPCYHGVGLSGMYLIWRRHEVGTAFLIGYAAPPAPAMRRTRRDHDPLPRQSTWLYRGGRVHHTRAEFPPVTTERLKEMYQVFKRGAVRTRREYRAACLDRKTRPACPGLGTLRDGIPDFAAWQALRSDLHVEIPSGLRG